MAKSYLASRKVAAVGGVLAALTLFGCLYLYWDSVWENLWIDNERLRNFILIIVATLGLPVAIWRSCTAHIQAATAQKSLLNERYQRATEMLDGEPVACLAGIYALTRMAERHLNYHVLIMSVLTAFVRTRAKRKLEHEHETNKREPSGDLIAVMGALGGRNEEQLVTEFGEEYDLDLRGTDLRGLLMAETKLPRAMLDDANLSDQDNKAIFGGANFAEASLVNVSLASACIYNANFAGADLSFSDLTAADLFMVDFFQADLMGTDFSGTDFNGNVKMKGAFLGGTVLASVTGLTQEQLNSASIDPERPPILTGSIDPNTKRPLVLPN